MSGKLSTKRRHAASRIAAELAAKGLTHREIAEQLGIEPDKVKSYITLGERLKNAAAREDDGIEWNSDPHNRRVNP